MTIWIIGWLVMTGFCIDPTRKKVARNAGLLLVAWPLLLGAFLSDKYDDDHNLNQHEPKQKA